MNVEQGHNVRKLTFIYKTLSNFMRISLISCKWYGSTLYRCIVICNSKFWQNMHESHKYHKFDCLWLGSMVMMGCLLLLLPKHFICSAKRISGHNFLSTGECGREKSKTYDFQVQFFAKSLNLFIFNIKYI